MVRPSVRPAGRGGAKNYTRFALPVYVTRRAGAWGSCIDRGARQPPTLPSPPHSREGGGGGGTTAAGRAGRGRSTNRPPRAPRAHACRWAATCSASSRDEHLTRVRDRVARAARSSTYARPPGHPRGPPGSPSRLVRRFRGCARALLLGTSSVSAGS